MNLNDPYNLNPRLNQTTPFDGSDIDISNIQANPSSIGLSFNNFTSNLGLFKEKRQNEFKMYSDALLQYQTKLAKPQTTLEKLDPLASTDWAKQEKAMSSNDPLNVGEYKTEEEEEVSIEEKTKQKYINPFGGVSLENSLFSLGQSLGSEGSAGNTLRGIGAGGKAALNIGRMLGAGLGSAKLEREGEEFYKEKQRAALAQSNMRNEDGGMIPLFRKGGKTKELSPEKALTGEFITGLPKQLEDQANAELEVNEFVKHPDGSVQKVFGKTHEKGGEKLKLEGGTLVVSDNLKIGSKLSKSLSKEFDLKLKSKETFADVVDKFTKKMGLPKLNDEQEKYFKKVEGQEEVTDQATQALNLQHLSGKIKDIEDKKLFPLQQRAAFTDLIFEYQEQSKTKK